jgi:hypothetical protein
MIEYVEIRNGNTRKLIGIIDTAKSVIWETVYYGVGKFEIYVETTEKNIELLSVGNLVTRPNDINCGIISSVQITENEQDGKMIVARGDFAKIILDRRIIYKFIKTYSVQPTTLRGNVAEAVWSVINDNCVNSATAARNFPQFDRGTINYLPQIIVDENGNAADKQVTYTNLLEFTDGLLQEYEIGSYVWLDPFTLDLLYVMYQGADRSKGNTEGNKPLIFSTQFDNLTSSEYEKDNSELRTTAIIGGEGEGADRFVARTNDNVAGFNRRELFIDSSSISKMVMDETTEVETVMTDSEYSTLLIQEGRAKLAENKVVENFNCEVDLTNSNLKYLTDYNIGDLVSVEGVYMKQLYKARILKITEVQDENGYAISSEFGY